MNESVLRQYASLIANVGGHVQKGQEVRIIAELDQPAFIRMLAEECYKAGAAKVVVDWQDQPLTRLANEYQSLDTLSRTEKWEEERMRHHVETLPVRLIILSEDPDGLKGIDQEKAAKASQARYGVIKPYRDQMENRHQWCIAAVPGVGWAKKVFPNDDPDVAVEKLWEAILHTSRADGDPVAAWEAHNADLAARSAYLNDLQIETLEYSSSNGTHFTVGLMPESRWGAGSETTFSGVVYNPNIPSEEVFTSPKRGCAEGIVYATKPLSYQGELIEDFWIRFEKGKAVEVHAEKNEALLKHLISMDEGAAYLGECALVPYDSPIRERGLLFYNTLFDENAACHLALGVGFPECVADFQNRTLEECRALGVNDSIIHEDFMIGSKDLSITAHTRDGRTVPIFRDGNWAF